MPQSLPTAGRLRLWLNTALLRSLDGLSHPFHLSTPIHMPAPLLANPARASHAKVLVSSQRASVPFAALLFNICSTMSMSPTHPSPVFLDQCLFEGESSFQPKLFNIVYHLRMRVGQIFLHFFLSMSIYYLCKHAIKWKGKEVQNYKGSNEYISIFLSSLINSGEGFSFS